MRWPCKCANTCTHPGLVDLCQPCTDPNGCDGFSPLSPYRTPVGYHIRDLTCGLNDPNGPVYDPKHGMYHLFYQDHLGVGGGISWGHVASRDLKKWVALPVALWNDHVYDSVAIYSGSATVVDGEVVLIYPGLCNRQTACADADGTWSGPPPGKCNVTAGNQCLTGRNLVLAKPADPSDPFLTRWAKPHGPIVNASEGCGGHCNASAPGDRGKDPSSAWRNPSGEWQLVTGGQPYLYGSMDFKVHGGACARPRPASKQTAYPAPSPGGAL